MEASSQDKTKPVVAATAATTTRTSSSASSTNLPKTGEGTETLAVLGVASLVASLGIVATKRRKN